MKAIICHIFLLLTCVAHADPLFEKLSAAEKEDQFFTRILGSRYGGHLPKMESLSFADYVCALHPSYSAHAFSHHGDTMKAGVKKLQNRYGTTALVTFFPSGQNPYTGLFSAGAPHGVFRVSLENVPSNGRDAIFIPSIAFKFFIDGKPSVDILAKPSTREYKSKNIFTHKFRTNLDAAGWTTKIWEKNALSWAGQPKGNPRILTLDHMAAITSMGAKVGNPVAPYALEFLASPELKDMLERNESDFRRALEGSCKGFELFSVFAISAEKQDPILICHIHARSEMMASFFGDETLFFRHSPAFVAPVETIEDF